MQTDRTQLDEARGGAIDTVLEASDSLQRHSYVALFYTHYAAMQSKKALTKMGVDARLAPVPRQFSASCGTCVKYTAASSHLDCMHRDTERVLQLTDTTAVELYAGK